ncbi:hypothetical protein LPTSP3_g19740 [Leptospira kobayashii]|uniref:DUF218 domain-containing protein n=1 Tax=Leptospira kobayashii TaxID=1917830 RepID=A0ABN6KF95_9LEPT|nr:hypothetical protein [Leptospira kobayashii]BDA79044.1 hypothetical protein LPTSP3_g19740 [Leptospira kobayashii]
MQVSDLTFRLKLFTFGFLSPLLILLGLFISAPYWLKTSEPYHKSDIAVLETSPLPSKKFLKQIASLYQKQIFTKLILVVRDDGDSSLLGSKEREDRILLQLVSFQLPPGSVQVIKISSNKLGDTDEAAKNILKLVVSDNLKSVLILAREFETKRILKTYQKNLASLPLQISAYPFPSELTATNWFLSEPGFREVSLEFLRYIYSIFRGVI